MSVSLPVNGAITKDGVVHSILNPDAGLVNMILSPWKIVGDGIYNWTFNKGTSGLCGFGEDLNYGCWGFAKAGVKAIQAPIDGKNTTTRVPLGYLNLGAKLAFPITSSRGAGHTILGEMTLGLTGTYAVVQAKKLDYIFGKRVNSRFSTVSFTGNFKINDLVSIDVGDTLTNSDNTVGKTHSVTVNFSNPK